MKRVWIGLLFFHVNHLFAQQADDVAKRWASTIEAAQLKKHVYTLASDEFEGRETGTPGQERAAAYISTYYESIGMKPVVNGSWYQQYPLKRETNLASFAQIGEKRVPFLDYFYFFGMDAQDLKTEKIVFAGYGIRDKRCNDYKKIQRSAEGSWIMCLAGEPIGKNGKSRVTKSNETSDWNDDVFLKAEAAEKAGAKALLIVNMNYEMYMRRVRYWLEQPRMQLDRDEKSDEPAHIPFIFISPEMANMLLKDAATTVEELQSKLNRGKRVPTIEISQPIQFHVEQQTERIDAENVLAFIEGSDPELKNEVVVVSAHYDHIGITNGQINNGADDDASGTSSAMEIGEAFYSAKKAGQGPRRSVLILHVSGEEKGLLGSEWYSDHPVYPLNSTVCDLNIDMVGRIDPEHKDSSYVYLIGSDKLSSELHEISEKCNTTYTNLALDYTYNSPDDPNRFYYRSDHYNFAKHNIPVIFYFSGVHEDYHKPGDDAQKILYNKMETIARLVFHTAWDVANRRERLKVDKVSDFKNE
ncbi:MAG: M28 family peptidase [Flavobacteriales bacterium]